MISFGIFYDPHTNSTGSIECLATYKHAGYLNKNDLAFGLSAIIAQLTLLGVADEFTARFIAEGEFFLLDGTEFAIAAREDTHRRFERDSQAMMTHPDHVLTGDRYEVLAEVFTNLLVEATKNPQDANDSPLATGADVKAFFDSLPTGARSAHC